MTQPFFPMFRQPMCAHVRLPFTSFGMLGYRHPFIRLVDFLYSQPFGDRIEVVSKVDRMITGNFEVSILDTGQVIHSKKHAKQGRAQTPAERRAIAEQIQEYLDELDE